MTEEEAKKKTDILKRVIEKAVEGGYRLGERDAYGTTSYCETYFDIREETESNEILGLIFSHDFVKAYWGEEGVLANWLHHGQQMFLAEDRLEYLGRFLDK